MFDANLWLCITFTVNSYLYYVIFVIAKYFLLTENRPHYFCLEYSIGGHSNLYWFYALTRQKKRLLNLALLCEENQNSKKCQIADGKIFCYRKKGLGKLYKVQCVSDNGKYPIRLFLVSSSIPPVYLCLVTEKPIWKNQVRRTGFIVYFEMNFYCLCSLQKLISKLIFVC